MGDSRLGHEHDAAATPAHVLGVPCSYPNVMKLTC